MAKKSTNAEIQLRISEVYGLLTRGFSRAKILRHAAERWDCSERQADTYIARAREVLEKDCEMSRPAFLAECLAGIREVRENAAHKGQHQVVLNAIQLQAKLVGLEA